MRRPAFLVVAIVLLATGYLARTPDTGGVALRDFEAYYAAGATWGYHGDPYGREIWRVERTIPGVDAGRDELLPFVGPPFGLPLWAALGRLPWNAAVAIWRGVMIVGFAAVVLGALRVASAGIDALDVLGAFAFGAAFAPLTSGAALGQAALPACAAIVATPLLLRLRFAYAGGLGALLAGLQPNLAVVLAARLREPRSWIACAGAAAFALGGSIVAMQDLGGIGHYFAVLHEHADAERNIAIQTTTGAVLRGFGASARIAGIAALGIALTAFAVAAGQYLSRRYRSDDLLVLGCAALPLAIPFAHEHDFAIVALPALTLVRRTRGAAWFVAAGAALAVSVDWLGLVQRPGSTLEAATFAAACACALVALAPEFTKPMIALPFVAAGCVGLIALPAAHHVLATWPSGLPAGFHVGRTEDAPAVWGAEQRAAGIAALDRYWAFLRLLPLAGCAALWGAASVAFSSAGRSLPLSTATRRQAAIYPSA